MDFSMHVFIYFAFVASDLLHQMKIHSFFCTSVKLSAMFVFLLFITVEGSVEISLLMYIHMDAARRTQVHLTLSGEFSVES